MGWGEVRHKRHDTFFFGQGSNQICVYIPIRRVRKLR